MPLAFRSLFYVPADAPDRLRAAFDTDADAVVADLEDAVPPDRKGAARAAVAALGGSGPPLIAVIETAMGLRLAYETASAPRNDVFAARAAPAATSALFSEG